MDQALIVFIEVTEQKNFTRAARALHMTQPAVSQYIQMLEDKMGARLFERTNKYVRLTKAGESVYHHAKEITALYTRMNTSVEDLLNKPSGDLLIGSSYTFGEYLLPHAVAELRERYPLIHPSIRIANTEVIADLVADHQIEVGIIEGEAPHGNLEMVPFTEDEMILVCASSHPLAEKHSVRPDELQNETWIIREEGSGTREVTDKVFTQTDITPENLMEFGSTQVIKESVEAGLGVSLLSRWAVRKELKLGTLTEITCSGCPVKRSFSLLTQKTGYQIKAAQVFVEILKRKNYLPF